MNSDYFPYYLSRMQELQLNKACMLLEPGPVSWFNNYEGKKQYNAFLGIVWIHPQLQL